MPKVSVCVPIYGVEKYIERCSRSLFEQTLDDMEFIFVDDCTKDGSIEVLKRVIKDYPLRKHQIKILHHKSNKGLSFARQTGVEAATGDYIAHCDSDDWVDRSMYETLYNKAIEGNYDYVKCGHYISDGKNNLSEVFVNISSDIDKTELLSLLLRCEGVNSIWDTLTKKKVWQENRIVFTKNTMLEDFFLMTQIIQYCDSFKVIQTPLYYYYQNPNSICGVTSHDAFIKRGLQAKENVLWIIDFIHGFNGDVFRKEEVVLKAIPRRLIIPIMSESSNYIIWKSLRLVNSWRIIISPYFTMKQKIQYLMVVFHLYSIYKGNANGSI